MAGVVRWSRALLPAGSAASWIACLAISVVVGCVPDDVAPTQTRSNRDEMTSLIHPLCSAAFSVFYAAAEPACMEHAATLKTDDPAAMISNDIPLSASELVATVSLLKDELVQLRADMARLSTTGSRTVAEFGAVCDGATNDTAAFQLAVDSTPAGGLLTLPHGRCFLGAPVTILGKAISIRGDGAGSVLVGDGDIVVGVNASFSQLTDFAIELHTQPWSFDLFSDTNDFLPLPNVTRSLSRSTDGQFSYSVNFNNKVAGLDQALRPEQKQQQEGLRVGVTFSHSDHVRIHGIRGTWATVTIADGSHCSVRECDLKGGNDALGTIVFVSGDHDPSWGLHNHATNNIIRNGANSGIVLMRQKYTKIHGNTLIQVGESGLKTWQGNCCGTRGRSRRCYHVSAVGNTVISSVYDGIDFNADYGTSVERTDDEPLAVYPWNELPTRHQIVGNMVLKPHGSAM